MFVWLWEDRFSARPRLEVVTLDLFVQRRQHFNVSLLGLRCFFFLVNKTLKSRCWNLSGHWKGGTMAEGSAALPGRSECLDSTHPETCCFNCIPNMKEGARGFEVRAFGLESRIASILFQRADFFQGADFCKAVLEELATSSPLKWNDA